MRSEFKISDGDMNAPFKESLHKLHMARNQVLLIQLQLQLQLQLQVSGEIRERCFRFQRLSITVQRFNSADVWRQFLRSV